MFNWDEAAHPREPKGSEHGGEFKKSEATAKTAGDAIKQGASRKRSNIGVFVKPIVGPSGASLTAYDWKWTWGLSEDGEDEIKVSDWDESQKNEHTGRDIVHHFHVNTPDGMQVVSVDSAIKLLGLTSEAGSRVRNLGTALMKLAQARQKLEQMKRDGVSEYQQKWQQGDIDRLEKHAKLLEDEAGKKSRGENPVDEYRDLLRKTHATIELMRTDPAGKKPSSSWGAVSEITKELAKRGEHTYSQVDDIRREGIRIFGRLLKSAGLDAVGGKTSKSPYADDHEFHNFAKAKKETIKASTDMQMRNWFKANGESATKAIDDAKAWLSKYSQGKEKYSNSPSQAQREAGNYKMEHIRVHGLPISIETPKGQKRRPEWPSLAADYGYFKNTLGKDGDHIDVFVGPDKTSEIVFVIDQVGLNGKFDEHKVLLGFANQADAIATYRKCYHNNWKVGPVTAMTIAQFKNWIANGKHSRPIAKQVSRYSMFEPMLLASV